MLWSRLPEIADALQPRADEGLNIGGGIIAGLARARAPVFTGRLQASIHPLIGDEGVEVVSDEFYSFMVEFGTSTSPAEPFLIPSMEQARLPTINAVAYGIRRACETGTGK